MRAPWLGLFGRQLVREVLVGTTLALTAGVALFVAVDFVEMSTQVKSDGPLGGLFLLEMYKLPVVVSQLGLFCAVLGAATATAGAMRRGEVVAMFAAGAPPSALFKPGLVAGLVVGAAYAGMTEWVLPVARARVDVVRRDLGLPVRHEIGGRRWFRGRDRIYRIDQLVDPRGAELAGVLVLEMNDGHLVERTDAVRLRYAGGWTGEEIVSRRFSADDAIVTRNTLAELDISERPEDFVRSVGAPGRMRYRALAAAIEARDRLAQSSTEHRLELHRRHSHPMAIIVAILVAIAMTLRMVRPSLAAALGVGTALGFALWIVDEVSLALGSTAALSPPAAAHCGLALVGFLAIWAWAQAFRA